MWPREQTEAGAPPNLPGGPSLNGDGANAVDAARPRPAGSKFTFPSGSRPLDGYTIKRGVGIGGFGEVYFATSDAGKEVALKRIQRNLDIELRGVRQCLNLKHQNLVALFDIKYDEQEQAWVVMEYVPGASLKDVIEQHPQGMPIEDVHRWFRGLAAGTAYLHDHGIVHRDLKPGNIFEDDGCVKIGDYGLSKFISCSRRSGQTESVGTFHYMAPEIGKGNYGREIDVYALGIILYEMLTGNVPFDGESTQEIIMKHLTADPDVSRMAQPYRYVIQRALLKDPQKRFNAVYEMVDALGLASPSDISAISRGIVRPVAQPILETPPVATMPPADELLFIGEDAEMVFGPVKVSSVGHESPPPPRTSSAAPAPQPFFSPAASIPAALPPLTRPEPAPTPSFARASAAALPAAASPFWAALDLENEPIWKATRNGMSAIGDWWNAPTLSTWVRIVVLVVVVSALAGSIYLVPALALVLVGYAIYLGIRAMVNYSSRRTVISPSAPAYESNYSPRHGKGIFTPSSGATTIEDLTIPPIVSSPPQRYAAPKSEAVAPAAKAISSVFTPEYLRRERRSILWVSMFFSALFAIALSIGAVLALNGRLGIRSDDANLAAYSTWLSVVSVASVWSILLVSRLFNTEKGTSILHRIVMGGAGALIGCGAMAMQRFLVLGESLPADPRFASLPGEWPVEISTVAFFVAAFAVIRWWKLGDAMRKSRFNLGAILIAVLFSYLIGLVLHFPMPWPIMIGAVVALALQLGASRFSKKRRAELTQPFAISA